MKNHVTVRYLPYTDMFFDGDTYEPAKDLTRLKGQLGRVFNLMSDGQWRTLKSIAFKVKGSEASVSARLRDFRKPRFGAYTVERERVDSTGLFIYRLEVERN